MTNLVSPVRRQVPMIAVTLIVSIALCFSMSILFGIFTLESNSERIKDELQIVKYQTNIQSLAVPESLVASAKTFGQDLTQVQRIFGENITAGQLLSLMEALQPDTVQLRKINFEAGKGQVLISAVSSDAQALQEFVSELDKSEYLSEALITRKSRVKGSDSQQEYAIKLLL